MEGLVFYYVFGMQERKLEYVRSLSSARALESWVLAEWGEDHIGVWTYRSGALLWLQ